MSKRAHDGSELLGGDVAISVLVEEGEGLLEFANLLLGKVINLGGSCDELYIKEEGGGVGGGVGGRREERKQGKVWDGGEVATFNSMTRERSTKNRREKKKEKRKKKTKKGNTHKHQ